VLLVAIIAVRASVRAGLPSLLLYLLIGVGLGDAGLGVNFSDAELANALGFAALVVILAEGGLTTSWSEMRPVARLGLSLATLGVAVSVGVVAVAAHLLFGMSWQLSVLLGALTSPTDAAAVFSVLRRVPLPPKLVGMLEAYASFWASAYKEVIVFTLIIPVLVWRSFGTRHFEEDEE
jgi:cell volume regulation protein A